MRHHSTPAPPCLPHLLPLNPTTPPPHASELKVCLHAAQVFLVTAVRSSRHLLSWCARQASTPLARRCLDSSTRVSKCSDDASKQVQRAAADVTLVLVAAYALAVVCVFHCDIHVILNVMGGTSYVALITALSHHRCVPPNRQAPSAQGVVACWW